MRSTESAGAAEGDSSEQGTHQRSTPRRITGTSGAWARDFALLGFAVPLLAYASSWRSWTAMSAEYWSAVSPGLYWMLAITTVSAGCIGVAVPHMLEGLRTRVRGRTIFVAAIFAALAWALTVQFVATGYQVPYLPFALRLTSFAAIGAVPYTMAVVFGRYRLPVTLAALGAGTAFWLVIDLLLPTLL